MNLLEFSRERSRKMILFKRVSLVCLAVLMLLVCVGCSVLADELENDRLRANVEDMLDAIIADDYSSAYALVEETVANEDFVNAYQGLRNILKGVESYEISILYVYQNYSTGTSGSIQTFTATYEIATEVGRFVVDSEMVSTQDGLSRFVVAPYEDTDYYSVGTVGNMKNAAILQWVFLLSNIVIIGAAVWAFVDCCRQKIKKKALWLLLIFIGFAAVAVTLRDSGVSLNLTFGWLTSYTAYVTYGGGTIMLRIMSPAGAIIYFVSRNSIICRENSEPEQTEQITLS